MLICVTYSALEMWTDCIVQDIGHHMILELTVWIEKTLPDYQYTFKSYGHPTGSHFFPFLLGNLVIFPLMLGNLVKF
jgi:hypothetical protein